MFPGDVVYVWHAMRTQHTVAGSVLTSGFEIRAEIVWAKSSLVISQGHYHPQHESCFYAVRKGAKAHWKGGRKKTTLWRFVRDVIRVDEKVFVNMDDPGVVHAVSGDESTVWEIPKPHKSETGHSTQKPVECMARPIRNHDSEYVYEPFSGSGTCIIACEQLGRKCLAIELSPAYVDVAIQRYCDFVGNYEVTRNGEPYVFTSRTEALGAGVNPE